MINIDILILDFIRENISNPFLDFLMPKISFLGNGGLIWIAATIVLMLIPKYRKGGFVLAIGLLTGLLLGQLGLKSLIARPRPFNVVEGIELLITAPTDFSFPSGHTTSSVTAAAILTMIDKRFGYAAIPLAVTIAFSRLYLYVHFPSDILGGIILAAIITTPIYFIFFKNKTKKL